MKLRNFDKSLFPSQGYFGVAVKRGNDIRSFTLAAGWNGLNALSITTANITASDFPDEVPQEFRRVNNSEISIHKDIKGVLSDSVYSFIFSPNASPSLSLVIFSMADLTANRILQSKFLSNLEECREFYRTYVQE